MGVKFAPTQCLVSKFSNTGSLLSEGWSSSTFALPLVGLHCRTALYVVVDHGAQETEEVQLEGDEPSLLWIGSREEGEK